MNSLHEFIHGTLERKSVCKKLTDVDRIDHAINEAEQEMHHGAEAVLAETVFEQLEKKYFG